MATLARMSPSVTQVRNGLNRPPEFHEKDLSREICGGGKTSLLSDGFLQAMSLPLLKLQWSAAELHSRNARCFMSGPHQGRGSRVIFSPFRPCFGYNYGISRAKVESDIADWTRIWNRIEKEFRSHPETVKNMHKVDAWRKQILDFGLLRELDKRLRVEEAWKEDDAPTADKDKANGAENLGESYAGKISDHDLMELLTRRLRDSRNQGVGSSPRGETTNAWMKGLEGVWKERDRLQRQWTRENERGENMRTHRESLDEHESANGREEARFKEQKARKDEEENDVKYRQSEETLVYFKNEANLAEIYLVGTSHVSQASAEEVKDVIRRVKPDYVMVELCRKRYERMQTQGRGGSPLDFLWQVVRMFTNFEVGSVGKIVGVGLSGFYQFLATRGFQPGQEFQAAIEEGKKVGAKIVLGDQDIDTTLRHLGDKISILDALRFFSQPMPSDIAQELRGMSSLDSDALEKLRNRSLIRKFIEEMENGAPIICDVLLKERNETMTKALRKLTGKVVAVVGLAHLDGMEQLLQKANYKVSKEE